MRRVIPPALALALPFTCLWMLSSWAGPPAAGPAQSGSTRAPAQDASVAPPENSLHLDAAPKPRVRGDGGGISDAAPRPPERSDAIAFDAVLRPPEVHPIAPDPVPLLTRSIYLLGVRFDRGEVRLERVRHETLPTPTALPRTFGRFAVELYVGPTLLERTRFDFPLIHDDSRASDTYERGLSVLVDVRVPDSDRPNRLEIWDRATDRRWTYRYPLTATP